ncbi:MAG: thioesterase [Eubacteriales bacterium]|nr:thioesterase [Eubacteriales bacterium]
MYTFDSRIRYSEIDHHRTITLPGIINYFQDCSTFQSESIGYGVDRLKKEGKAWILSYWQIVAERYPKLAEPVKVCTWATGFKGFLADRNFQMLDAEGNQVAYANSVWVYMDMKKGRPVRPGEDEVKAYGIEEPLDMEYAPRKIRLPKESAAGESFPVRKYHIDTNEHVNNCQYVQMALEVLEEEMTVHQVRVEYKRSAVYNDIILPKIAREESRTVVELCDQKGGLYAVVELIGE